MSDAAYLRIYRAAMGPVQRAHEVGRNKAWWRAHRRLAKKYPADFFEFYEEEKRELQRAREEEVQ